MDLVVLSEVRWSYFRTRKQFLLSRFPDPWRVFFAQPAAFSGDDPWQARTEGRVTSFAVPFLKPATQQPLYNAATATGAGRALIEAWAERHLMRRLGELGVGNSPVAMVSNIYCAGALSRLAAKLIFYDFNDHPLQFAGVPGWAPRYWRATLNQVDSLFVVSEHYRRELAGETSKPLFLLGNGVETAHFSAPRPEPADLAAVPRPRIGYLGLLSHFLDFDTLEALRRARGSGTVVLIGPESGATRGQLAEFGRREGVVILGARPYSQVPAYLQALDVGVIPFRANTRFVRGINPNKVYQYLAAGLPVVSTPLLDLPAAAPHLQYASSPDEMVAAVRGALAAPHDPGPRRAIAQAHDWDSIAARMVEIMNTRLAAVS
ncbi:MAG: glycosyltransferase [Candidatus Eiseniibacteriota bacterium]